MRSSRYIPCCLQKTSTKVTSLLQPIKLIGFLPNIFNLSLLVLFGDNIYSRN